MTRRTFVPASILGALLAASTAFAPATPALAADEAARAALPAGVVSLADPVALGFGRMLAHAPNTAPAKVPAGFGEDPLLAAVVWALHGIHPSRHAVAPGPQALAR